MDKAQGYLTMARKAGLLTLGAERCTEAAEEGKLRLLLVAADASERSRGRAEELLTGHRAPLSVLPWSAGELSDLLGKSNCSLIGFTDLGLASAFASAMKETSSEWQETAALLELRRDKAVRRKAAPRKHKANRERGGI